MSEKQYTEDELNVLAEKKALEIVESYQNKQKQALDNIQEIFSDIRSTERNNNINQALYWLGLLLLSFFGFYVLVNRFIPETFSNLELLMIWFTINYLIEKIRG